MPARVDGSNDLDARLEQVADELNRKVDGIGRAILHLAKYLITQQEQTMSAKTDAILADLAALEEKVTTTASNASVLKTVASAAEESAHAEIRDRIAAIHAKVDAMNQPASTAA